MSKLQTLTGFIVVCVFFTHLSTAQTKAVQPFLPEIISRFPNVRDITISQDGMEIYFTTQSYLGELSAIVTIRKERGNWTSPEVVSFSGQYQDLEPFLTPDGLRCFFASNRPLDKNSADTKEDYDIWYVERISVNDVWSAPVNIGAPVNTAENEFYPSVSKSGNLYFTSDGKISKGKDDIFVSKLENGKYQMPVSVDDSINSTGYEFNAFIAPDESFLIFTCYNKAGGFGSGDLYISFNKGTNLTSGNWTAPENLGKEINSAQMDYCPFVDVNSGVLYFTSKRTALEIHPEHARNIRELTNEMQRYENGQSRLYKSGFNTTLKIPRIK